MSASGSVRAWLVERDYDDKGLVRLVYATPDGDRRLVSERSAAMLRDADVTAAVHVDPDRLDVVRDEETKERYAAEVARMQASHDATDPI